MLSDEERPDVTEMENCQREHEEQEEDQNEATSDETEAEQESDNDEDNRNTDTEGTNQSFPEGLAPVIIQSANKKTLKCPKCDKTFDRAGKYESHTRVHTGEKPFECEVCHQRYSTKSNLTVHRKKHNDETAFHKKEHKCPYCNKLHASKKTLTKHVKRFHPDNVQEFLSIKKKKSEGWKCDICNKSFTRRPHLEEHMILHTHDRPFKCAYCEEHFKSRFARLKLRYWIGKVIFAWFPSGKNTKFNDTGNRKRHIECTHGGKRKWTCFICGKSVRERLHLRVHHDDKRYECDECGKTFIRHDHLTKHRKIHSGEKAHQCEECGKCFGRRDHLTVHYRSVHLGEKVWQKYKAALHQCEVCKKEFKGKSSLEMHFRTHSGEKPYKCQICNQTFRIKKTLTKHMVIHSDARPFNCPHCNATFKRKDKLKYHIDHVHGTKAAEQSASEPSEEKIVSLPMPYDDKAYHTEAKQYMEQPKVYQPEPKTILQSVPTEVCVPVTLVPVQMPEVSAQADLVRHTTPLPQPQTQQTEYQPATDLVFLEKYTLTPQPTNIVHPVRPDQMLGSLSLKSNGTASLKMAKSAVAGVAQSQLTFIKPVQTVIPRHPLPFAAKNMFYDERWMEKEEQGFTWWINYILTPDDFKVNTEVSKVYGAENQNTIHVPKAPTKEEMSFKTYTANCRLNRLRRAACRLFASEDMVKAIRRLEIEIEARRFLVRKDRHLWKDIGERQKVLNWLLSYNPLWLRIGLETVFGELVSLESNSDVMGLAMFILSRLLWNPDIAAEYRHPKVPHLYRDGHEEALSRFTLKKLLLLVCFLDRAKQSRIIEHDPCLFCLDSEFKIEILLDEEQLREEISFLKRAWTTHQKLASLRSNGVPVDKKKDCSVDLDYSTKVKLLMDWVNAVCAFHNIKVENFTVSFSDGRVLCYLIHHYHPCYLALDSISQNTTQTVECGQRGTVGLNSSASDSDDSSLDIWTGSTNSTITTPVLFKELLESEKRNFQLVNTAVANLGGVPAMISHLDMSNTIPSEKERTRAACIIQSAAVKFLWRRRQEKKAIAAVIIQVAWRDHVARKKARERELAQLYILQNAAATVIQAYWKRYSASKHFQELRYYTVVLQTWIRTKIALAAYKKILCGVVSIQKHFRAFLLARKERQKYVTLRTSATVIQRSFRRWKNRTLKRQNSAAAVIQNAFRKWQVQRLARRSEAAVKIQSWYRMYRFQKQYFDVQQKVIKIQAWFKSCLARQLFQKRKEAVLTIQKHFTAYRLGHAERQKYLLVRKAATVIQSYYRGMKGREFVRQIKAVCLFETFWQMKRERVKFLHKRQSAVILQSHVRRWQAQMSYQKMRKSISLIQACYRAYLVKKKMQNEYKQIRSAAIVLQSAYRGMQARKKAHILRSVIKMQAYYRAYAAQKEFRKMKEATIRIQAYVKMVQTRRHYFNLKKAVHDVQRMYRANKLCLLQKMEYRKKREACVCLQAAARGYLKRRQMQTWKMAAIKIQSTFRMHKERSRFLEIRSAALVVQKHYRAHKESSICQSTFLKLKAAAVCLQASYRGSRQRKIIQLQHKSATKIQAAFRAHATRTKFLQTIHASVVIQRQYRAFKAGQNQRMQYMKIKLAAATLQAAYRGHVAAYKGMVVRKEIVKRHQAATVIQAAFRMHRVMIPFQAMRLAAVLIQRQYRAYIQGRNERVLYLKYRNSATLIQAAYRGMRLRQQLRDEHNAAAIIQAQFRMYQQNSYYKKLQWASKVVQQKYRACKERDAEVQIYKSKKQAAVVVQSAFRGMKIRKQLKEMKNAARLIQRRYKAFRARQQYLSLKAAAVVVQQRYRAHTSARLQQEQYCSVRAAAISIQVAYKGMIVRKEIVKRHQAATVIQAAFRMHRVMIPFQAMRLAAVLIQRQYRAYIQGRNERVLYLKYRNSATLIQAAYRGMRLRQQLRDEHNAAAIIQAQFRMYQQNSYYKKLQWASKVVQQKYRACKERDAEVQIYKSKKQAAVVVQSAFRGMKSRQYVKDMHKAATAIQRKFKAHSARKWYLSLKAAAVVIQQKYRALIVERQLREEYSSLCCAAITIQAVYRGLRTRKHMQQMHHAATVIQAAYRMHRVQLKFQAMRLSAVIIQLHYMSCRQGKKDREKYLQLRKSALTIQSAFRGKKVRQNLAAMHKAATIIQACYRMHRQKSDFKKLSWATKVFQQRYRALRTRDAEVHRYNRIRKAVSCIQAAFRAKRERELTNRKRAAQRVQSFLKMCVQRRQFLQQKAAAVVLQSAFRGYRTRVCYRAMRLSAVVIQRWYRAFKVVQKQKAEYQAIKQAAVTVQSAFRGMTARTLAKQKRAAIKIQSVLHMAVHRRKYIKLWSAAVTLQAHYRAVVTKRKYTSYKTATLTLQKHYRARQAKKLQRSAYLKTLRSILLLQATIRGYIARKRIQMLKKSVVKIQAMLRGYIARRLAKKMRAAQKIQAWYKGCMTRREYKKTQKAIATVRGCVQTRIIRNRFLMICRSVGIIQRRWRETIETRKTHQEFIKIRSSAVKIQAAWRGYSTRKQHDKITEETQAKQRLRFTAAAYHHVCAMKIQRMFRAHLALKRGRQQMHSVICIQRWITSKLQRKKYLKDREKIIKVQRVLRAWLNRRFRAATVIQRAVQKYLCRRRQQRVQHGVVKIQALWRGFCSRKRDAPKVVAIRRRVEKANKESKEENKLCNKTATAIDYLLRYNDLSYIIAALKHLEAATRLSSVCCENLAESGAISTIFILIRSCNRSVPCMEVIAYAIQVLLNLSKYEKTIGAVYEVEHSIDTLLDLLQIYREKAGDKVADKGGSIFTKTCFLLTILLQDERNALAIRKLPKAADRIRSIYKLTARKHKMDAKLTRQKMNKSLNGSFFAQATPVKTRLVQSIYKLTARKHKMDAKLTRQKMNKSLNGSFFAQATPVKTRLVQSLCCYHLCFGEGQTGPGQGALNSPIPGQENLVLPSAPEQSAVGAGNAPRPAQSGAGYPWHPNPLSLQFWYGPERPSGVIKQDNRHPTKRQGSLYSFPVWLQVGCVSDVVFGSWF
ncbi:UNVERIFIED_CONTAM: hypothetical protein FKN15_065270 [Acipenser sinensis]